MSIVQNVIQADGQGPGVLLLGAQSVVTDNVIAGAFEGVFVGTTSATIRRNTLVGNAAGLYFVTQAGGPGVVATSNNLLGNDAGGHNCGVLNGETTTLVQGNYWGSATGPGDDPADDVCGRPMVTSPFLTTPVKVGAPAGR
jgi:nitrous oxidase accessory protein NosD